MYTSYTVCLYFTINDILNKAPAVHTLDAWAANIREAKRAATINNFMVLNVCSLGYLLNKKQRLESAAQWNPLNQTFINHKKLFEAWNIWDNWIIFSSDVNPGGTTDVLQFLHFTGHQ